MPRYVALLRGINVGGNNLIPMVELRAAFEALGFTRVETYIQSGNVVFDAKRGKKGTLVTKLEAALSETFSYAAKVVLVSADELARVVAEAPAGFGSEPAVYRYDVAFVKEPLDPNVALAEVATRPGVDTAHAGTLALYFRKLIEKATQSRLPKLAQRPVYQSLTLRNWNTTTRLLAMVSESV
ncbi:MAG: DUF1697 domain-containing protein [Myxococcales bacterium]|nr:DUF1697 domain-containing protein [Myxococcales bacterium]